MINKIKSNPKKTILFVILIIVVISSSFKNIKINNMDKIGLIQISHIASEIPGTSISKTLFVASGVTSLGPKPVPPVVIIMFVILLSVNSINVEDII